MNCRHAEDALDAIRISDDDLNVRFGVKTRAWVERFALNEDATKGIDRRHALILNNLMQPSDYGAIQIPSKPV